MLIETPDPPDILNASATATTASLLTIPASRWFTANIVLSASVSGLATGTPRVSFNSTGSTTTAFPANGSVLHRLSLSGIALTTVTDSCDTEILVYGGDSGVALDFNSGGATSASVVINGMLI